MTGRMRTVMLTGSEITTVIAALEAAAEAKRDADDMCSCDIRPDSNPCTTCTWRLSVADEYDALRDRLEEATS
jgi:hypothetical protein